jgi:hypothetical protein
MRGVTGANIFDRFGKFPGTVPSVVATIYLQAHHLDLEFYDAFYKPAPTCEPTPSTWRDGMGRRLPDLKKLGKRIG